MPPAPHASKHPWHTEAASLRALAAATLATAELKPGARIAAGVNTTGHTLHLPGGNEGYPAFWVRDAAMMLGGGFISAAELEGWIRGIAATQPGPDGIALQHGLSVPGYSIPDHINLNGRPVWFPGTYADGDDQGDGAYGCLPPADDAFYFIQMVRELVALTGSPEFLATRLRTGWGEPPLLTICDRAFHSVAADPDTGLVRCEAEPGRTRVDWGFCDSVRKTGLALFPTLLRHRAACELAELHELARSSASAARYRAIATQLRAAVPAVFLRTTGPGQALLLSATDLGRKDDVWGSAFAIAEGLLDRDTEQAVCRGLHSLFLASGIVRDGQVRALPPDGPHGGFWEQSLAPAGHYQNGGFWGTMSGWLIVALAKVDPAAALGVLRDLVAHVAAHQHEGAPWEWINPSTGLRRNPLYCASVALPYATLARAGLIPAI